MRPAKIPSGVVIEKVLESLRNRMDPETRLVRPSWRTLMREIGVCRQRIANAVFALKNLGRIKAIHLKHEHKGKTFTVCYYAIVEYR